jgi:anti-sigma regulatory factor (Ser/Thr protein kinase)
MVSGAAATDVRSAVIRVPATADALALLRLFAAAIGRYADQSDDEVEDLKLALTELCSAVVEVATTDDAVTVEVSWRTDPADIEVHVGSSTRFWTRDPGSSDRARLLAAMGLELRGTDDGHGVTFTPPRGTSS